jgi:hypothetical protein
MPEAQTEIAEHRGEVFMIIIIILIKHQMTTVVVHSELPTERKEELKQMLKSLQND